MTYLIGAMVVDLKLFKFKTIIDFVVMEFKLNKNSNAQTVRRKLGATYVKPLDKGQGSASSHFQIKIYDVDRWLKIEKLICELRSEFDLSGEPIITGVELSLDAFSNGASIEQMTDFLVDLSWLHVNKISLNKRFVKGGKGTAQALTNTVHTRSRMQQGGTIYIGDQRKDNESMRFYYKITDRNMNLPEKEHRSRMEITLMGDSCPFRTIDEAKNFNFVKTMDYFRTRQIKQDITKFEEIVASATTQIGERKKRNIHNVGTRMYSKVTKANVELNQKIYDQLKYLTQRLNLIPMRNLR